MKTVSKTASPLAPNAFTIRDERSSDVAAREALLDVCFGEDRDARTCQRLRDGRLPAQGLAFSAVIKGRLVGTLRLWHVSAGGRIALVLGPLAVDPACQKLGIGGALMRHAIDEARRLGHDAIVLLGDAPYYARFGFAPEKAAELHLPGTFERERLLGLELTEAALDGAWGMIVATGRPIGQAQSLRGGRRKRLVTRAA
jgi:predicted N-acetyltransferase YhbS